MKELELNLDKIAFWGEEKEQENFNFRTFLKGQDFEIIDSIVHRINKQVSSQIDCRKCGNCCKSLRPSISESELEKMSKIDNISKVDFETHFVEIDDSDTGSDITIFPKRKRQVGDSSPLFE